jgi:hypothetical protein
VGPPKRLPRPFRLDYWRGELDFRTGWLIQLSTRYGAVKRQVRRDGFTGSCFAVPVSMVGDCIDRAE